MDPTKRLMFWLKVPYAADVALALIGVALLASGRGVGWWVLVFAAVRAVIGTIALVWVAPRMLARRSSRNQSP
jgi:membrane protein YdbS with pleckstrin-like domain